MLELGAVLDDLDSQKDPSQQDGRQDEANDGLASPGLGCPHGQSHCQAAADENRSVDGPEGDVELMATQGERRSLTRAVNDVGGEQAAEEHDLRDQEDPHSQIGSLTLLIVAVEMVGQTPGFVGFTLHRSCPLHGVSAGAPLSHPLVAHGEIVVGLGGYHGRLIEIKGRWRR